MNVVGFDVSKDRLVGARIDRSSMVKEHWDIANTPSAVLPVLSRSPNPEYLVFNKLGLE